MLQQEHEGGPEESAEHYGGIGAGECSGLLNDSSQLERQMSSVDERSERKAGSSGRGEAEDTMEDVANGGPLIASASGRTNSIPKGSARIIVKRSGSGPGRHSNKSSREGYGDEEKQGGQMTGRGELVVDMEAEEEQGSGQKTGRHEQEWGENSLEAPQSSSYVSLTVENRANEMSGIFPR